MADNDQSKVRYDDFVGKVQADPASPQSTIMLQGYVGRGPEAHVRIYPDPTLGNWYDVPEADIVHSMEVADSKLGGSYVWIKSSAAIRPGSAAPAASQGPAPAAAPIAPAAHLLPTPQTLCQPTPQTHCFICPPHSQHCTPATICTHQPQCPGLSHFCPTLAPALCPHTPLHGCPPPVTPNCTAPLHGCPPPPPHTVNVLHCPTSPIICDIQPSLGIACTVVNCHTPPVLCQQVATMPGPCPIGPATNGCNVQPGAQQIHPQAFAAPAPAPAAAPQAAAAVHPALSQNLCHSNVLLCGPPQQTVVFMCTNELVCGMPTARQCPSVQVICPTPHVVCPTPPVSNHIFCHPTFAIACLQTAQTPCLPQTIGGGGCNTPQLTLQFTPLQNGVFNPFGR
jgi:hypothetical protein